MFFVFSGVCFTVLLYESGWVKTICGAVGKKKKTNSHDTQDLSGQAILSVNTALGKALTQNKEINITHSTLKHTNNNSDIKNQYRIYFKIFKMHKGLIETLLNMEKNAYLLNWSCPQ